MKMLSFKDSVYEVVRLIPKGSVMTYKEVAAKAGNIRAARAVGTLMAQNRDVTIPCHRVIRSDGSIGDYNGLRGISKGELLKQEGVVFTENNKPLL